MVRRLLLGFVCTSITLPCLAARLSQADDRSAADLLPPSTVLYTELRRPERLIDGVLGHPLRQEIESLDGVQQAYASKQFREFKAVLAIIESQLGKRWPELLKSVAGDGLAAGVDAQTQGVAILIQGPDEDAPREFVAALVRLARQHAQNQGNPDPVQTGTYRGVTAYGLQDAKIAVLGRWLIATNKGDLGKQIIDRYLDQDSPGLAGQPQFKSARDKSLADAVGWAYADLATLRAAGVAKELFDGNAGNPLGELLIGGILSNLQQAAYATATANVSQEGLTIELQTPHKSSWIPESRRYYYGPQGTSTAPVRLNVENAVFTLSTYRDISDMWLRSGDLYNERVNDQIAAAESNLSTLFSGKDFAEDILGAVAPEMQLVVARQLFEQGGPQPAIKLPAFAAVFKLNDPEMMRAELRRTFQSLIGFLNVIGAMNGQPQLDLDIDKQGEWQVVAASYIPEKDANLSRLPINFNFSPAVAFVRDRFVVASTGPLARELAGQVAELGSAGEGVNTVAALNVQVLKDILGDNREQLVAQNMLEEGHSREEAEYAIDLLLKLVGFVRDADFRLNVTDDALKFVVDIRLVE